MLKNIFKTAVILFLGAVGGFIFQVVILPYLFVNPYFGRLEFIKILKEKELIVNPKEEIFIRENLALELAVEKVQKSVVSIQARTAAGNILEGSGLIVTSDGLMITLNKLLPFDSELSFLVEGKAVPFQILRRDFKNNLALVKLEGNNFITVSFADFDKLRLGERVFLVGRGGVVNEGVVRIINENSIKTNIFEEIFISGSPLFNIEGKFLGLNTIDKKGMVSAIPLPKIINFLGF